MRLFALYWIQEIHRRTFPIDDSFESGCHKSVAHRNRACDTLHLGWAMRAGTAKRSRLILASLGKTLDHRRLFTSGLLYRFTDATAGKIFARDASAFSIFCVYGKKRSANPFC